VDFEGRTAVVADIPGLIEGAHEGHGLGLQFLRHIERTRLLLHIVDVSPASGRDPVEDLKVIEKELASYSETLARRPRLVVANKMDSAQDEARVKSLVSHCRKRRSPCLKISAVTGEGIPELLRKMMAELDKLPAQPPSSASEPAWP
jgi:GTP-binding protein